MAIHRRRVIAAGVFLGMVFMLPTGHSWYEESREQRAGRELLRDACGGVLPEREARAILGGGPLKGSSDSVRGEEGLGRKDEPLEAGCLIVRKKPEKAYGFEDASIGVSLHGTRAPGGGEDGERERPDDPYPAFYPDAPVPLPGGWTGFLSARDAPYEDRGTAAVFLDCAGDRRDLLVTVSVRVGDTGLGDPAHRIRIGRLATATARNAAQQWGCEARFGERPRTVPLPVAEDVPLGEADGTCEGVPARGRTFARAWESDRGGAPQEVCSVGNSGGTPLYSLRAFYGPYATSARVALGKRYSFEKTIPGRTPSGTLPDGGLWATAACPAPFAGETALFTIEPLGREREKSTRGEQAYERAALKAFAEASAEHHGCSAPRLP
ncbi:hypothetical protein [Streptomyces sp. KL2]|uniref:hypothetical protein n=1 Tax=Streptomyces sp. KL2 TaxID=3050126 RepID=UPI00397D9FB4